MEVDGSPVHLDMDGRVARRAAAAGVTILISSDSHRADALGRQMRFGIGTARRGWVGPDSVLNARDTAAVEAFVASKRTARG
jgi:DNA polymerase (family 10)